MRIALEQQVIPSFVFEHLPFKRPTHSLLVRILNRPLHRRRQSAQIVLEDEIHGTVFQCANGIFLTEGARYENEGNMRERLSGNSKSLHAVEIGHGKIGQNYIGLEVFELAHIVGGSITSAGVTAKTGALELPHHEFGIIRDILNHQDPDRTTHKSQIVSRDIANNVRSLHLFLNAA
ncbi:MAG TPA: hypothetical protein VF493_20615 [Terriglobales bacterium]